MVGEVLLYIMVLSLLVALVTLCAVLAFAKGDVSEEDVWIKALIVVIAIGILVLSISQVSFLNHPEDYGYIKIEEVTEDGSL